MTVETNDILKIVLDYIYPGAGTALNIIHYVFSGTATDDTVVVDAIEDWVTNDWGDKWADLASDQALLNTMHVYEVSGTGETLRDLGSRDISLAGAVASQVLPAANSVYILGYTQVPGVRGCKYVPAIAEAVSDDGVFPPAVVANIILLLVEYLANINIGTGTNLFPGVVSSKAGGFRAFTDEGLVRGLPAYQRRRKDGVGS